MWTGSEKFPAFTWVDIDLPVDDMKNQDQDLGKVPALNASNKSFENRTKGMGPLCDKVL